MSENNKPKVEVLPFDKMKKISTVIDIDGRVLSETVVEQGQNKFDILAQQRKQRLGL